MSYTVPAKRWEFAQERELLYQQNKATQVVGERGQLSLVTHAVAKSRYVEDLLSAFGARASIDDCVLEVGSGAHGIIWKWPASNRVALDPLAVFFAANFPFLQSTDDIWIVQAKGETIPFPDGRFDFVFSDNVLDHTESPEYVLREVRRVLKPSGVFYFVVDVHHPIWNLACKTYNLLFRFGMKINVKAFPHHPFHFTQSDMSALFSACGLDIKFLRTGADNTVGGIMEQSMKKTFYKNRRLELIATRNGGSAR